MLTDVVMATRRAARASAAAAAVPTLTSRPHPVDPDRVLRLKVAIMEPRQ